MKPRYQIISIFDTETTNIGTGNTTRAFCILYIFNDLRECNLYEYVQILKNNEKGREKQ